MTDKKIQYTITGDPAGLEGAFRRAEQAGERAFQKIQTATAPLTGMFEKVNGYILALTAVLAGGKIFKESVEDTVRFSEESRKLAEKFGITATEAGVLNVALGDVHSTGEEFAGLADKLTQQLRTNEKGLNAMGLATRGANGEFRDQRELMLDGLDLLNQYKAGTDRNQAAQVLFGKGAGEMNAELLKLSRDGLEAARVKSEELGLAVGADGQKAVEQYKGAMSDVHDVLLGMGNAIGSVLMPILTVLGKWFAQVGPTAIQVLKGAVGAIALAFWALKEVIDVTVDLLFGVVDVAVQVAKAVYNTFTSVGAALKAFVHGDFATASAILQGAWAPVRTAFNNAGRQIAEDSKENFARAMAPWLGGDTPAAGPKLGNKKFEGLEDKKDANKAELQDIKGDERVALQRLEFNRQMAQMDLQQHLITKTQLLQQEIGFENQRYDIQRTAMQRRIELLAMDPATSKEKRAELNAQLLELEEGHTQKVALLNRQAAAEGLARWRTQLTNMASAVTGSISSTLQGIANSTASFADLMKNIFASLVDSAIGNIVRMGQTWLDEQIGQLSAKKAIDAADVSSTMAAGSAKVGVKAAEAGAGATAATAETNPYGAVAIGLGVMLATLAAFSIASASRGYDIPAGVNPVTQLHEREMVLPAAQADAVRDMASRGGGPGNSAFMPPINIYAMDSQDVIRALGRDGALRKAYDKMIRNVAG